MERMPLDIPPAIYERVVCSVAAATKYNIPANVMLAVAFQEAGKPGQAVLNNNGTYDYGSMQINTVWLTELRKYNISKLSVNSPGCYPYDLAAWRIRRHIVYDKNGDFWQKVANYHSYTIEYNLIYRHAIIQRSIYWADWLSKRYLTIEITNATTPKKTTIRQNKSLMQKEKQIIESRYVPRTITSR